MVVHISILKVKCAKNSDTTLKFNDIQYHFNIKFRKVLARLWS